MLDPFLAPKSSYMVKLPGETFDATSGVWARENCRCPWNWSGLIAATLGKAVYFWFTDEYDCDRFRLRFGGALIIEENTYGSGRICCA